MCGKGRTNPDCEYCQEMLLLQVVPVEETMPHSASTQSQRKATVDDLLDDALMHEALSEMRDATVRKCVGDFRVLILEKINEDRRRYDPDAPASKVQEALEDLLDRIPKSPPIVDEE